MNPPRIETDETTLVLPIADGLVAIPKRLAITVLWHPDGARVGARAQLPDGAGRVAISRFEPDFGDLHDPHGTASPLASQTLSRAPVVLEIDPRGGVTIEPSEGRMRCQLDGQEISAPTVIADDRLDQGAILRLGPSVLLCLHRVGPKSIPHRDGDPLGTGAAADTIRRAIGNAAASDVPVLILGETGVGKELVAHAIHARSRRAAGPMIAVNMATLSESLAAADLFGSTKGAYTGAVSARAGLFAEADGGTLFLDEVGDAPSVVQPMLLRVLETGEFRPVGANGSRRVDVRVIAATDRDLGASGFNQPLRRRLEGLVIEIPPLRARREDIGLLLRHFLHSEGCRNADLARLPGDLIEPLCRHGWPGNVRELGNIARRIALALASDDPMALSALGRSLDPGPIAAPAAREAGIRAPSPDTASPDTVSVGEAARYRTPASVSDAELLAALERSGWQVRAAANELGVSRPSMYALIDACRAIRKPQDIPRDELLTVIADHPGQPDAWAAVLHTPREALRRWVVSHGLAEEAPGNEP